MKIEVTNKVSIGPEQNTFIIAEIGNNHNGNMEIAKKLVDAAHKAGVSAVKFQTKNIEASFSKELLDMPYTGENSFGSTYREHKQALEFNAEQHREIFEYAKTKDLIAFSTPFDVPSVDLLESLNVPLYKISSFHVVDEGLLDKICSTGKPVLMSTGMTSISELDRAVAKITSYHDKLVLLHCVSSYPTEDSDVNLSTITMIRERYGLPVGYSGHERGVNICTASIALGGCVIERHFTLDRTMKGPDHAASVEPTGMELIVKHARQIQDAIGVPRTDILDCELKNRKKFRGY